MLHLLARKMARLFRLSRQQFSFLPRNACVNPSAFGGLVTVHHGLFRYLLVGLSRMINTIEGDGPRSQVHA